MKNLKTFEEIKEKENYDLPNNTDKKYWTLLDSDNAPVIVFELDEIIKEKEIETGDIITTYSFDGLTINKTDKIDGADVDINNPIQTEIEKDTFKKEIENFRLSTEEEIDNYKMLKKTDDYNL